MLCLSAFEMPWPFQGWKGYLFLIVSKYAVNLLQSSLKDAVGLNLHMFNIYDTEIVSVTE